MGPFNTRSVLPSPCYDQETKTDCPRRCGGCQVGCPDWEAYLVKRDAMYKERARQHDANSAIVDIKANAHAKYLMKVERLKRMKRGHK